MIRVTPMHAFIETFHAAYFALFDNFRRAQAKALDGFGFGPQERDFQAIASGPHWRLRDYGGADAAPSLLIVASPIKRPYIWDLSPAVSAIRYCLERGLHVYLLEWIPPSAQNGPAGLDEYVGDAIATSVATITNAARGRKPFLIGHSLGGTLAAIFCALEPTAAQGVVLLGAPLCFEVASSGFRDKLVSFVPADLSETAFVAGSLLSRASAAASPSTFMWSKWKDAALSLGDPAALNIHARIERWSLDEVALPAKLVKQIVQGLYRDNQLLHGSLPVCGKKLGPSNLRVPTLAIVSTSDEIGPLASVAPFVDKIESVDAQIIEYSGEVGVVFQHLGMLVGREAFAQVWPRIISWLRSHS
jgi:polyhydroxyalkanoate synthase subunit PhaC